MCHNSLCSGVAIGRAWLTGILTQECNLGCLLLKKYMLISHLIDKKLIHINTLALGKLLQITLCVYTFSC